jgi:dolichol-phosphate mannosyltransferase
VKPSLSIVVPGLNESANIQATYGEMLTALRQVGIDDYEILFIDDCSADNTFEIMQRIAGKDPRVRPTRNETNLGLGGSYKKGVSLATKEFFMLVPGDNAWPAQGLAEALGHLGEKDIIIPYIVEAGDKGPIRKFLSRGFTTFVNLTFGLKVRYYNGIVIHRLANLRKITIVTDSFAYQAEALVKLLKMNFSYLEIGLNTVPRGDGKSKALKIPNLIRVATTVLALRWKFLLYGASFYKH